MNAYNTYEQGTCVFIYKYVLYGENGVDAAAVAAAVAVLSAVVVVVVVWKMGAGRGVKYKQIHPSTLGTAVMRNNPV